MINVDFIDSSEVTTERVYQWDIGQKLKISNTGSAIAPVVHFCNKKSEKALAVESVISGDFYIASVPNSLLEEEYDIIAYIYVGTEEEAKTIKVVHIPVTKRLRPETYVTTEDENVVDFLAISAEMKSLLNGLVITEYDSTKSYIKPNIVYYKGCSYICKSETNITNILPTDTTKWGLMCESGANVSDITFSGDALHFKLQNNDIVDVPLGSVGTSVVEVNPVIFDITKDENGVLKIGDVVIPQKKLLWSGSLKCEAIGGTIELNSPLSVGDKIEIVWDYYHNSNKCWVKNGLSIGLINEINESFNMNVSGVATTGTYPSKFAIISPQVGLLSSTQIGFYSNITAVGFSGTFDESEVENVIPLGFDNYLLVKAIYKIIE